MIKLLLELLLKIINYKKIILYQFYQLFRTKIIIYSFYLFNNKNKIKIIQKILKS